MNFSDKVVVITGGASGIGGAATRAFAAAGAKVAFTYQSSADEAAAVEAECRDAGQSAVAIRLDVRDPGEIAALFDRVARDLGPADVLFANAGGLLKRQRCADTTLELWQEAMSVNVYSAVLASQAALRQMEPRGSGAIVLMSSLAAFDGGGPGASHYAASKGAVATLVRSLAKEVGPSGIRVNGVAPGLIGTRFHDVFNTPEGRAASVARTPIRREGTPQDVADTVLYLASDKAAYVTGEVVQINGGVGF